MDPIPLLLTVELPGDLRLLKAAARLQLLARRHAVKPTWLVGVEALDHPALLEPLARWQKDGEGEVGAWVRARAVPPVVDLGSLVTDREPVLSDFPDAVLTEKLAWMSATLGQAVGRPPTTVRATPPAVDERFYQALSASGFRVDLTVVPHARFAAADFGAYSEKPYLTPQGVLEVPRTVRRRTYGAFVEDWLKVPGPLGAVARRLFPTLRSLRLQQGNRSVVRALAREALRTRPSHLEVSITADDWSRGEALGRDLDRVLHFVQGEVVSMTADEFQLKHKNDQLRKGLL